MLTNDQILGAFEQFNKTDKSLLKLCEQLSAVYSSLLIRIETLEKEVSVLKSNSVRTQ